MKFMSYCPKCGRKYEDSRFKCTYCGSLLAYAPIDHKPGIFEKIMRYRSFIILLLVALIISSISYAIKALTGIYWLIIISVIVGVVVYYIRNRKGKNSYQISSYIQKNAYTNNKVRHNTVKGKLHKPSNVIPFKRKKDVKVDKK